MNPNIKRFSELTSNDIGKEITLSGIVHSVSQNKLKLRVAIYKSFRCGSILKEPQYSDFIIKPSECYKEQGGCGRHRNSTNFILSADQSEYSDYQEIKLKDILDKRYQIKCILENDNVGKLSRGKEVIIKGKLVGKPKGMRTTKSKFILQISKIIK